MSKKEKVSVVALDARSLPRAQALALRLNTAVSCDPSAVSGMVLEVSQDRLALRDTTQPRTRALTIDAAKRRYAPAGKDLLVRALGRQCRTIIDATAGFGSDTFDSCVAARLWSSLSGRGSCDHAGGGCVGLLS